MRWKLVVTCLLVSAGCTSGGTERPAASDASVPDDSTTGDARCALGCGPLRTCCAEDEECVSDRCLPRCDDEASRCGADESACCATGELCIGGVCTVPGVACAGEDDCDDSETCEPLVRRCLPVPESAECRYRPPVGVFEPEVQWQWTEENAFSIPLVVPLDDDNADGVVDATDPSDVVVLTYAEFLPDSTATYTTGHLTALSGVDGHRLWQTSDSYPLCAGVSAAAGDLDGDGRVEIVAVLASGGRCGATDAPQRVVAFDSEGEMSWTSTGRVSTAYGAVAIADLDADGSPEVLVAGSVFRADGSAYWHRAELADIAGPWAMNAPSIADLDGDGMLEVAASNAVFRFDGSVLWSGGAVEKGYTAVAILVDDRGELTGPQLVAVNYWQMEILDGATGRIVLGPIEYEGEVHSAIQPLAGPPTIADFDGDGLMEIGVAGYRRYVVFDPDGSTPYERWSNASSDRTTGSVGSTVFDFDADGMAEVVYADECSLRILRGSDGALLWSTTNTSRTVLEYPVVADVDGDGNAELVVVSNEVDAGFDCASRDLPFSGNTKGVRVYRDKLDNWVPTRTIWNEHTYHIDNVTEDGAIPTVEPDSWRRHNTYRLNRLVDPAAITLSPDLVVVGSDADLLECPARGVLHARVQNQGSRGVPAGVPVAFYGGDPPSRTQLLGVGYTSRLLLSGAATWVDVSVDDPPLDATQHLRFYAVADDNGTGVGEHSECHEGNNAGAAVTVECTGPE